MKRTNLVLDGEVLEEARRALGARTYSETVNKALAEAVRLWRVRQIPELLGQMRWIGNLSEMREDQKPAKTPRKNGVKHRRARAVAK